ncbi:hypothetical protein DK2_00003 [Bacillus phage DK2]|uniref:Uncharacterized protein n=1 Tax=Bacillus phage DK2 TaxID=2500809 RepID=A0A3T0IIV6_9CAUD|nr:nucleotide kinase [Bacillus phage DK2]AZU99756.1 hypothetical protein DK2_00003 [Bacillus phage DK2]
MIKCSHCKNEIISGMSYQMEHIMHWGCYENYLCDLKDRIKEKGIEKEDVINKPNHYHGTGIDPISIGEIMFTKEEMNGFYKMNMLKYWYRAGKKDGNSKEQDLKKYEFYRKKLEGNE